MWEVSKGYSDFARPQAIWKEHEVAFKVHEAKGDAVLPLSLLLSIVSRFHEQSNEA